MACLPCKTRVTPSDASVRPLHRAQATANLTSRSPRQILYPTVKEIRQILVFLADRFPKDAIKQDHGTIDFLVHSIAYADKDWLARGKFTATPREVFTQAMDISAYTYMAMADRAAPLMKDGGSMIAMSYLGAEKAVPGYNVMGVAKAALEAATRYLAMELGSRNIRVNTISGGPLRTMSAMAVAGFGDILGWVAEKAPLQRNITGAEVGDSAVYLLSDLSSGVTGQILHVDAGFSTIGL